MRNIILLLFSIYSTTSFGENRIKVAVIDTGIGYFQSMEDFSCKNSHKSHIDQSIYDDHRHGTNIVSIIGESINPKTHCVESHRVWSQRIDGAISIVATILALESILKDSNTKYVNISMNGLGSNVNERLLLQKLLNKGVIITVAAGNEGSNLNIACNAFPACYGEYFNHKNFHVVKSSLPSSNFGRVITDSYSGYKVGTPALSGTSQASAQAMSNILKSVVVYNRRGNVGFKQASTGN